MSEARKRRTEIWSAAIVIALIASAAFVLQPRSARAGGDNHWYVLDVSSPQEENVAGFSDGTAPVQAGDVSFTVSLQNSDTALSNLTIFAKFEGGPNDPDPQDAANGTIDYSAPDGSCQMLVATQDSNCTLTLHMPVTATTLSTLARHDPIRFWIKGRRIDTQKTLNDTTNGCIADNSANLTVNGDGTDLVDTTVIPSASSATTPTNTTPGPPSGIVLHPAPLTCTADGATYPNDLTSGSSGGPTPTPTASSTSPSPSPSPSSSGSTSPSPSPSASSSGSTSPSPSGSPSPSLPPGSIDLSLSPTSGVFGTTVEASGIVTCAGVKIANAIVDVFRRIAGQPNWVKIETESDVQGRFAIRDDDLYGNAYYGATWDGNEACSKTAAAVKRAFISVGVITNIRDASLHPGEQAIFYGRILPAHQGKRIALQMYRGDEHRWAWVGQSRLDKNSDYQLFYTGKQKGYLLFRVVYLTQDLDHVWNIGRTIKVTWG